jgi:uncharacterized protein YhaN
MSEHQDLPLDELARRARENWVVLTALQDVRDLEMWAQLSESWTPFKQKQRDAYHQHLKSRGFALRSANDARRSVRNILEDTPELRELKPAHRLMSDRDGKFTGEIFGAEVLARLEVSTERQVVESANFEVSLVHALEHSDAVFAEPVRDYLAELSDDQYKRSVQLVALARSEECQQLVEHVMDPDREQHRLTDDEARVGVPYSGFKGNGESGGPFIELPPAPTPAPGDGTIGLDPPERRLA